MGVLGLTTGESWLEPPDGRHGHPRRSLMDHVTANSELHPSVPPGSPGTQDDPNALSIYSEAPTAVLQPQVPRNWPEACQKCQHEPDAEACCTAIVRAARENPHWFGVLCLSCAARMY